MVAPTAGLHLTSSLLSGLSNCGIQFVEITLHLGYGTFQPIRTVEIEKHRVEAEWFDVPPDAAAPITTAVRRGEGRIVAGSGVTDLYIYPGFDFRVVGGLITNFHFPRSSLLVLVCAFAGHDQVLAAYREADRAGLPLL